MSAGILCRDQVKELLSSPGQSRRLYGRSGSFDPDLIGKSAIDLPLGGHFWEMKGSCRTGEGLKITDIIQRYSLHPNEPKKLSSEKPIVLEKRHVYVFEVDCCLDLTDMKLKLQGKATGRSSIGRLDVLVRLLVDESDKFDVLQMGKKQLLYVEVTPISFDLEVKQGMTLSQLRLFKGREEDISLTREELYHEEDNDFPVVDENGEPNRAPCECNRGDIWFPFRLDLSADPTSGCSAFVVKKNDGFPAIDPDKNECYDPREYWEPVRAEDGTILLHPDRLYILRSKDRLRLPGHLALECRSYTTQMGEWRIEYAGFAHPGFGHLRPEGAPIIFEVRGHNVPTVLTDGIPLGNVRFIRMSQAVKNLAAEQYDNQELKLSSCFAPWPDK